MRFLELELQAYGPFTNVSLDLRSGQPGLHVIFGPNEAGKSAALRALHALLYGIPVRTDDDFLHDKSSLRIGARIRRADGTELSIIRQKRKSGTLLNPETQAPYPDDVLQPFLGGVDGDTFARVYGIGHKQLVEGGEELRRMRGLAGESLFAAGMGGVALADVLRAIHDEASALRASRGGTIKGHIDEYRAALGDKEEASKPASEWERLDDDRVVVEKRRAELVKELESLRTEHLRTERHIKAVALVRERRALLAELAGLPGEGVLPASYSPADRREAAACVARRSKVEAMRVELDGEGGLRRAIASLVIPEELLRQADTIESLRQRLGAHLKAAKDVSKLRTARDLLQPEALGLLRELRPGAEWDQVDALRLASDRRVRIQNLASEEKEAREQPGKAAKREANAASKLAALRRELAELSTPGDAGPLGRTLRVVQKHGDLEKQRADARRELGDLTEKAERALERLGLGAGALPSVEALRVPSRETVDRFANELALLDADARANSEAAKRLDDRASQTAGEISVLRKSGDVPSESSLEDARAVRDDGWALIRAQWLEGKGDAESVRRYAGGLSLADAYESKVKDADDVSDRLRREAARVAQLASLLAAEEEIAGKRAELSEEKGALERRGSELLAEWSEAWAPAGVRPQSPAEMRAWLAGYEKIVTIAEDLRKRRGALEEIESRIATARASLIDCLAALEEPAGATEESLAALVERCEEVRQRLDGIAKRRVDLEKDIHRHEAEREEATRDRLAAEQALEDWRKDWLKAVIAIGGDSDTTGPEANERIARIDLLLSKAKEVGDAERRIDAIQSDARDLKRDVSGLVERVAPDLVGRSVEEAIGELVGRLEKAREDVVTRKNLIKDEKKLAERLAEDEQRLAEAQAKLEELCRLAGVERPDQLEEAERVSAEVSRRRQRLAGIDESLSQLAGSQPIEEFVAGADDPDALGARRDALKEEIAAQDQERTRLDQRLGEIHTKMESFDGSGRAAEADEKALGILARIRDGAERYIRLKVAEAFLQRQIERHRAATQDPILARAGQLFAALTCGAFESLRTEQDEKEQPIVVGVRPGGGGGGGGGDRLTVDQMSDGTADQLYLALRLAYLEQQLQHREPLPVVLDDVLVNFDDARARATLQVLGELGRRTQVLLFTHHERNVDLARAAVPEDLLAVRRLGHGG